jgi:hypothetical protein
MSAADNFLSLFDEQGRYTSGDGDVGVIFLTKSGTEYPGKLQFKSGLLAGPAHIKVIELSGLR